MRMLYNECIDIIWTIARIGLADEFREIVHRTRTRRVRAVRRAGKLAGYCWPRNDDESQPMCEEIRDYAPALPGQRARQPTESPGQCHHRAW
jgi:hypothetical protein